MVEFETKTFYRDGRAIVGVRTPKGWIDYDTYKKNPARFGGSPTPRLPPYIGPIYGIGPWLMGPHDNPLQTVNTPAPSRMPSRDPINNPTPTSGSWLNQFEENLFVRDGKKYRGIKTPNGWVLRDTFIKNPAKFGYTGKIWYGPFY